MLCVNYLFIDLNSYFASVEQELNPSLRSKPVAVVPSLSDYTCCIAVSYEAKAYGIKTGTSVKEAKRLCPKLQLRVANHPFYVEYHHKVMAAIESVHPIFKIMSIDECVLRLGGTDRVLENAIELSHELKKKIYQVGGQLSCSIGISINIFLSKLASDMQKPNGLTYILKEDLPRKLYPLPLRAFPGIGNNMLKRLHQYGITTTKQLCDLDMHSLRQIWGGVTGERFYQSLKGIDVPEIAKSPTKSISQSHVLSPAFRNENGSYQVALSLLQKASFRLREQKLWARSFYLSLRFVDNRKWSKEIKCHETQDTLGLIKILKELWAQKPKGNPKKVSLYLLNLISDKEKNLSLFDQPKLIQLSAAIDAINKKHQKNIISIAEGTKAKNAAKKKVAFSEIPDFKIKDD